MVRTGATTSYSFEIPDRQGTNDLSLDSTAQVPAWRQFTPYGAARGAAVTWTDNRGFLNKPADAATGLTYVGARAYDPGTGQFISPDPVLKPSDPQDLDPYAYAEDNPVTGSDPTGLWATPTCFDCTSNKGGVNGAGTSGGRYFGDNNGWQTEAAAWGCGAPALSCGNSLTGGTPSTGPAPMLTSAATAPPRPKRETVMLPASQPDCSGRLFNLGACPGESGAAGTTPGQVKASVEGAALVLTSFLPIGDAADAAVLGGRAVRPVGRLDQLSYFPEMLARKGGTEGGAVIRYGKWVGKSMATERSTMPGDVRNGSEFPVPPTPVSTRTRSAPWRSRRPLTEARIAGGFADTPDPENC